MEAKGCRFHVGKRYQHFVDAQGRFVEYPAGYITGPCCDPQDIWRPWYISVAGPDGWRQRSFCHGESEAAIAWALEEACHILAKLRGTHGLA